MTKDDFRKIVAAYQAAMGFMIEAKAKAYKKGPAGQLEELALEVVLHFPIFVGQMMAPPAPGQSRSIFKVMEHLGAGYKAVPGVSPRTVLQDAWLLLAVLSDRLEEEKYPPVQELVDKARKRLFESKDYELITGVANLEQVPQDWPMAWN